MTMDTETRQSIIKEVGVWFDDLSKEFPNDTVFGTVIRGMITRLKQGEIPPRKMPKVSTSPLGKGVKEVFRELDKLRGYRPPKRQAEAASILRMLKKQFTPEQIIESWETLKKDKFWAGKELFMMTVESQIGAMTNKTKPNKNRGIFFSCSTSEDIEMRKKYQKGEISHDEWIEYMEKRNNE